MLYEKGEGKTILKKIYGCFKFKLTKKVVLLGFFFYYF